MTMYIYKSKNSAKEYYLVKSLCGPYALYRLVGVADRPISLLRRDMEFVKTVDVA